MRKACSWFVCSIFVALLITAPALAQILTGTISGTVVDPTDARIPNAKVKATDLSSGREFTANSDNSGAFTINSVPNGFYRVEVEAPGFTKTVVERVQVFVSQTATVVARMEVGRVGTEVVVQAQQTVVQTESVELKNSIDRAQILNLPLPTRNPLDLVRTMAGIVSPTSSGIADSFVHGLRGNATNLTQDGINVADNFVKTSSFFAISAPTVDTVGEFNVSVGGIGADAGFGAAQVSMVTQRGGNEYHGTALWFQRNSFLNANTWFNNASGHNADGSPRQPRPFQLQNRLGGGAGGPVWIPKLYNGRNRTWFFGHYEAFREPLSRPRTRTVLTPSARQGLFSWTPPGGSPQTINLLGIGTIGNSTTAPTINTDAMNFYNALVPAEGLTDAGCASDTLNIRCYPFNLPGKGIQDRYTLRFDHNISQNHSFQFVWNQADFDSTPDLLNGIEPNFPKSLGGGQGSRRQVFVWALTSTFGGNKTNEARVGYQRAPVGFNLYETYQATNGFQLNVANGLTDPTITSTNLPQGRNTPVRQVIDNFGWVKGSHNMRIGGEYRQILANSYFYNVVVPRVTLGSNAANPNGITSSDFPGGITAGDLARAGQVFNVVTGLLGSVQQGFNHTSPTSGFVPGVPRTIDPIQHNVSGYVQDTWKMKPGLTAQYGVRYEFQGVFDLRNQLVLLPTNGLAPNGDVILDFAGGRNGKPIWDRDWNNFAPFAGFAWDPFKNGKTSIRGSFSSHFTQDGFTLPQVSATGNTGLFAQPTNTTVTGVFRNASNPGPPAPTAVFPVSQRTNFVSGGGAVNLWDFRKDLATPYILEWNFGIQRELFQRLSLEVRYVGNHAVKQFRSYSINDLKFENGLLGEFETAQRNLQINAANGRTGFANNGLAGQSATVMLDRLFANIAAGSAYSSAGFTTNLQQNEVGRFWDTIRRNNTYLANREANFARDFFVPSPYGNNSILVDNPGWSYFHGLEVELNRRFTNGFFFQSNYTYSKVLTDTNFLTNQQENQNYRLLSNTKLDKNRAAFDLTHSFSMNALYPLPIGRGKALWGNAPGFANIIVGGWQINSFTAWSSGSPFTITSNRQTTASLFGETAYIRNMTASDLQQHIGVFRHPTGVFWLNPDSGLLDVTGSSARARICTAGQTTPCFEHPGTNQMGNLPLLGLQLPRFFNQTFNVIKNTKIGERFNFEIRLEFFNAFNIANFANQSSNIDASNFGKLTATADTVRGGGVNARIIQWASRVTF